MLVLRHLERTGRRFPTPIVTLGNFDGVHRGHQEILQRLVTRARAAQGTAVVLTFHPHPAAVLAPGRSPQLITDWRARIERIAETGVDVIIVQRFTPAFATVTAEDFVRRFLVVRLRAHMIVVGHRVSFGYNRRGNAEVLQRLGAESGLAVEVVGAVEVEGMLVSSSAVRQAIAAGDLRLAESLLGRAPAVAGRVIHGRHRGRQLGFPTANLRITGLVLPPDGVYAVRARTQGKLLNGVANIGFNPTFQENQRSVEVHLFSFDGDLYGKRMEVSFVHHLRGEIRFPSPQALVEQIERDVEEARRVLADPP